MCSGFEVLRIGEVIEHSKFVEFFRVYLRSMDTHVRFKLWIATIMYIEIGEVRNNILFEHFFIEYEIAFPVVA